MKFQGKKTGDLQLAAEWTAVLRIVAWVTFGRKMDEDKTKMEHLWLSHSKIYGSPQKKIPLLCTPDGCKMMQNDANGSN
jgi:hypothetical protein